MSLKGLRDISPIPSHELSASHLVYCPSQAPGVFTLTSSSLSGKLQLRKKNLGPRKCSVDETPALQTQGPELVPQHPYNWHTDTGNHASLCNQCAPVLSGRLPQAGFVGRLGLDKPPQGRRGYLTRRTRAWVSKCNEQRSLR